MNTRKLSLIVCGITLLLLAAGVSGAFSERGPTPGGRGAAAVAESISYQGRLADAAGNALDGSYTMRFIIFDDEAAGTAVYDSGDVNVTVDRGLFNVQLEIDQNELDGQALWLSIMVDGETLSPRQEILPAPYALGLRPGADIVGEAIGAADATLAGYAPATGTALYADASGGTGLFGDSEDSYGVWGTSNDSWGGYFTSDGGYGIRVDTAGSAHFDHGAYITSDGGHGVLAQSANNQALRGEAGNMSNISTAFGRVGVVGMGENRGVHGASNNGLGVYGTSTNSTGVYGNTSRTDRNYGLYTSDNLFSFNINLAGAVMQVMQNGGSTPLSPGDVVVFSGIGERDGILDGPVVQVSQTNEPGSTAVAGVVFSRFDVEVIGVDGGLDAGMEVTPAGKVAPGEFLLVVVQGPARVNATTAGSGSIRPGDLLSTHAAPGVAGSAATITLDGMRTSLPGTVFAKALERLDGGEGTIYVYVTLQ